MATAKNTAAVQMPVQPPVVDVPVRTPEQQAEIDRLRAEKMAQAAVAAEAKVADAPATQLNERFLRAISALADILYPEVDEDAPVISWKRRLAAFFGTIMLAGGAGYAIGQLAGYAMLGCYALTGSAFLMYTILVLALILAFYVGMKIGQHVGNYILSGQIDRDVIAAKNKVVGWFKAKPKAPAVAAPATVQ